MHKRKTTLSSSTLWFVLILEQKVAKSNEADDYGHVIPEGCNFISGYCLEKCCTLRKGQMFEIMVDKKAYIYRESIVYMFVNIVWQILVWCVQLGRT